MEKIEKRFRFYAEIGSISCKVEKSKQGVNTLL